MDLSSPQLYIHLLVLALFLTLPGMALYLAAEQLGGDGRPVSFPRSLLVGVGLSIAFWPLLLLYISLLQLRFTPILLWSILIVATLYVSYRWVKERNAAPLRPGRRIAATALGGLLLFSLYYRLGDVQGLTVPLWGDSLHHTMITTIIVNTGRVPTGYLPYVPVDTFTYHFGFHTLAAVFAQLTSSQAPYAVLLTGQALNITTLAVAYLLNRQLFGSRLAGLGAALITGFISIMPAFYVNWGRYTQLSGQVLLPVALVFLVRAMNARWKRSDLALCALCVAGLVVVHYRILIFFGLFAISLALWQLIMGWGDWRAVIASWARGVGAVGAGLLLTLPWIINLVVNYLPVLTSHLRTVTPDYLADYNNPGSISYYTGRALPALALVGLIAGIAAWVKNRGSLFNKKPSHIPTAVALTPPAAALVVALWSGLLFASLWVVPGAIGSYTVAITLYIPFSALGGYGISRAFEVLARLVKAPAPAFGLIIVALAPLCANLLNTSHVTDLSRWNYVQPADLKAFRWVQANTPPDAKFLISSQISYKGRGVTASDAGMWLPLLAQRNVSVPALSAWTERPLTPTFFTMTKQLAEYTQPLTSTNPSDESTQLKLVENQTIAQPRTLSDPVTLGLMKTLGISYIYSGAGGGASQPRLDLTTMRRDVQHYKLVYFSEGVYIFAVSY